ncbi:MAG: hypothetical protein J0G94_07100 [Sphingomonadales bacterium]|nr:hypothetical protein [Sphingomonadales bacterium]
MDEFLQGWIDWLNAQPFQQTIRYTEWVVPTVQTIHIVAVAVVITAALVIALRGVELTGREWSLARWHQRFRSGTIAALWVLLATGLVMTLAEPERELLNWIFRAKMVMVIVTLIIAHFLSRRLEQAKPDRPAGGDVRAAAFLVLLCWIGIATAGRWIAYAG